jgi:toluene monooxygenase system protein A
MPKLNRDDWIDLGRKLDWNYSYVREEDVFPELLSGRPWLPHAEWQHWDEPYRTSYAEYVETQADKDAIVQGVREAVGRVEDFAKLDRSWLNGLKLHAATMAFTEFTAGIGDIRGARFGRDGAWRTMALFGALDEFRHTQIPLLLMHELVRWDPQFDWTHRLFHTNNWMAIALRHLVDEMCVGTDPLEFAIATNLVLETGFTNLQFIGLSAIAHDVGDRMFEKMVTSIQTDEARHAQIGHPVLATLIRHDPERAQYLVDKWFWRSWIVFAVVTGFSMDYLTPLAARRTSFKEFMEEWITDQFQKTLTAFGLKRPWYWDFFIEALDTYHHMVYASAYTYRATMWFDFALPGPEERAWLREKYPHTWDLLDPVWERITERWRTSGPGIEWSTQGATMPGFCNLCQIILSNGTPRGNAARVVEHLGRKYIFCSEPCAWIFSREPDRYADHKSVVDRMLAGEAPANLVELTRTYFEMNPDVRGEDMLRGRYPWLRANRNDPGSEV